MLLWLAITAAAAAGAFLWTRGFVRSRLRFVDALQKPAAPIVAGAVATLVALPVVALLPIVGTATAVVVGAGTALGVAQGRRPDGQA
ncbi:MAG: hypothetical protein ACREMR_05715 [Gemmatimonadales bacterium]